MLGRLWPKNDEAAAGQLSKLWDGVTNLGVTGILQSKVLLQLTASMESSSRVSFVATASAVQRLCAGNAAGPPRLSSRRRGRPARGAMERPGGGWHASASRRVSRAAMAAVDLQTIETDR